MYVALCCMTHSLTILLLLITSGCAQNTSPHLYSKDPGHPISTKTSVPLPSRKVYPHKSHPSNRQDGHDSNRVYKAEIMEKSQSATVDVGHRQTHTVQVQYGISYTTQHVPFPPKSMNKYGNKHENIIHPIILKYHQLQSVNGLQSTPYDAFTEINDRDLTNKAVNYIDERGYNPMIPLHKTSIKPTSSTTKLQNDISAAAGNSAFNYLYTKLFNSSLDVNKTSDGVPLIKNKLMVQSPRQGPSKLRTSSDNNRLTKNITSHNHDNPKQLTHVLLNQRTKLINIFDSYSTSFRKKLNVAKENPHYNSDKSDINTNKDQTFSESLSLGDRGDHIIDSNLLFTPQDPQRTITSESFQVNTRFAATHSQQEVTGGAVTGQILGEKVTKTGKLTREEQFDKVIQTGKLKGKVLIDKEAGTGKVTVRTLTGGALFDKVIETGKLKGKMVFDKETGTGKMTVKTLTGDALFDKVTETGQLKGKVLFDKKGETGKVTVRTLTGDALFDKVTETGKLKGKMVFDKETGTGKMTVKTLTGDTLFDKVTETGKLKGKMVFDRETGTGKMTVKTLTGDTLFDKVTDIGKVTEEDVTGDVRIVRRKRDLWPYIQTEQNLNSMNNSEIINLSEYPSVYTETTPEIYSSYVPPVINVGHYQDGNNTTDNREIKSSVYGTPLDTNIRTYRSFGEHTNRSSVLVKGVNKHARSFIKSPQQRHARGRNRAKRKVTAREVWSLAGDTSLLPCDLTVTQPKDSVQMVMWLKEGTHTPLFSVDYREHAGVGVGGGEVWRDNTASTALRAHLRVSGGDVGLIDANTNMRTTADIRSQISYHGISVGNNEGYNSDDNDEDNHDNYDTMSGLIVRDVQRNDSAVYRCRVDFLLTPTRNTRVNLTVVVPPVRVSIRWWMGNSGNKEENGEVGPFREGDTPTLVCTTQNAWPTPRLVWFEEDTMVDDTYAIDGHHNEAVENTLTLNPLTRTNHNTRYTCIAANSNITRPVASTVHIDMALDVLSVKVDDTGVLSAGVQAEVKCTVLGSNPPPIVSWSLAGTILPSPKPWVSNDGNRSVSIVHLTPQATHDGSELQCSAHNPVLTKDNTRQHNPISTHRNSISLHVNYPPQVTVSLGRTLDATNIKEGDDVYFECSAIAKPTPYKVEWKHNGKVLVVGGGVLVSNMTLVLQKVERNNAGLYTCLATNKQGSAESPPLPLDVKYAPVCASNKASQHSVAKHENARISCNVLANPPVVEFSWSFNNTAEAVKVPEDRYVMKGTESVVNYTPVTELDYGTLLCWAQNDIGRQIEPCVFQILAAGKPDPPHNCRAYDVTISSLQVSCLPGDDGGLGQTFILEVLEANGNYKPVVVVNRETPSFSVANLRPATAYRLLVKANNMKGESTPAELNAYTVTITLPQHETPAEPTRGRDNGSEVAIGVLVGTMLTCIPVVITVVFISIRTCNNIKAAKVANNEQGDKNTPDTDTAGTARPLLSAQGGSPGSGGCVVVSCDGGSTDITTITGGITLTSPHQQHTTDIQVGSGETKLLYRGPAMYSANPGGHDIVTPQVLTAGVAPPLRHKEPYPPDVKVDVGDNELLQDVAAVPVPPPAAYNQGYQASYPPGQCYNDSGTLINNPGYTHVFQPVLPGGHMPPHGYLVPNKSGHTNLHYISSLPLSQSYSPQLSVANNKVPHTKTSTYATVPQNKVTQSSSFSVLSVNKDGTTEHKMSTVYNPLTMLASGQAFPSDADTVLNTGSLKRGIKPHQHTGQEVLRIRDHTRSRSASLSSITSKKESSV